MTNTHGQNLKHFRLKKGLSVEQLVADIQRKMKSLKGVKYELTYRTYERMEREGYLPKRDGNLYLKYLAKELGCAVDDICVNLKEAA